MTAALLKEKCLWALAEAQCHLVKFRHGFFLPSVQPKSSVVSRTAPAPGVSLLDSRESSLSFSPPSLCSGRKIEHIKARGGPPWEPTHSLSTFGVMKRWSVSAFVLETLGQCDVLGNKAATNSTTVEISRHTSSFIISGRGKEQNTNTL